MLSWLLRHMQARDTEQEHRASTPLELFFDLTFVVAVSFAAAGLAEAVETGRTAHGVAVFAMAFFAIWWGWLNFTWFASAYDTDDWLYRIVTLVQMGGALSGRRHPPVFSGGHFTVIVVGYVIMRLAMVCQWLRAWRNDRARRATATIYIVGITSLQVLWVVRLSLPAQLGNVSFVVLMLGELAIPALAERRAVTMFHRGHVAERYGLFTISCWVRACWRPATRSSWPCRTASTCGRWSRSRCPGSRCWPGCGGSISSSSRARS